MEIEPSFIEASPELEYTEILLQICFTTTVLDHWNATCIINVFFPTKYPDVMNYTFII